MLRIGVIGLGIHGLRYAEHIQKSSQNIILEAVCRRNKDQIPLTFKQSTKVFNELNPNLSREWEVICERLGINDGNPNKANSATPKSSVADWQRYYS